MDLGERIKFCRKHKKMTQEDLAEILGVTRQTINTWEHGKVNVSKARKQELAMAFGIIGNVFDEDVDFDPENMLLESVYPRNMGMPELYFPVPKNQLCKNNSDFYFRKIITTLQSTLKSLDDINDLTSLEMVSTLLELTKTKLENKRVELEKNKCSEIDRLSLQEKKDS